VLETNASTSCRFWSRSPLPAGIVAARHPKSSTGRLDVFTRVIADGTRRFDMIGRFTTARLCGDQPKTFPVLCAKARG